MSLWRHLTHGLRVLVHRTAADREVVDELRHYEDEAAAEFMARGLSSEDARRAARVEIGSVTAARDEIRAGGWEHLIDTLLTDLRYAVRRLWRSPAFTTITAITLALGIGANTAIFSIVNGVLLAPLPFPQPDRLVALLHTAPGINIPSLNMASSLYFTYREETRTFADVSLWRSATSVVTGGGEPEELPALFVTHRFLPMLGVQPALGRSLTEADERPNGPRTVIISHGYWSSRFGGDPTAVGRRLTIGGDVYEVIGVLPSSFDFGGKSFSLVMPLLLDRASVQLVQFAFQGIARLKPGVTFAEASADVARMLTLAPAKFPVNPGFRPTVFADARMAPALVPLKDHLVGDIGRTLWLLMATVGLVLLIACANVANLLLVRADARHHELAVRAALGAGWGRIARTLLIEGLVLGAIGGAFGFALASAALEALHASTTVLAVTATSVPRLGGVALDWRVLAFTVVMSMGTGFLFGMIPVLRYGRPHVLAALRGEGRAISQTRERQRARSLLVVIQVALAIVLLIGVGLMTRTFVALRHVDPGFSGAATLQSLRIGISTRDVKEPARVLMLQEAILEKIAALPGVDAAAVASAAPMAGGANDLVYAEDHPLAAGTIPPARRQHFMSPGLIRTIGGRLIAGRDFTWDETRAARPVALVSENLAREWWGTPGAALGKRIRMARTAAWSEIIGVVADLRDDGIDQKAPAITYWPLLTSIAAKDGTNAAAAPSLVSQRSVAFVIRTPRAGSPALVDELRQAIWRINPNLLVTDVMTAQTLYDRSLARTSLMLTLLALAGTKALLLAMIGLYGVIAYAVSLRTREIGIRLALGAPQPRVAGVFLRYGLRLSFYGTLCGLGASLLLAGLLRPLLFDVRPTDPIVYLTATGALLTAALLASYLPARRASRVDPIESLRAD
jgi:putative ABC transport system permease protein